MSFVKKSLALLLMTFISSINVIAANNFYVENFSIKPGEKKTISVYMSLDAKISNKAAQLGVVLPEGLSFVIAEGSETGTDVDINPVDFTAMMLGGTVQTDGSLLIMAVSSTTASAGKVEVFTFDIEAASTFTGGDITFKKAKIAGKAVTPEKTTVTTGSAGTDVTMKIDAASKYGTFVAPFDVTIPAGVKAYTATVNGEYAELTEITTTIPANTAVVVYSETDVNETFTGVAGSTPVTTGALTGVFAATEATVGTYVLQNQGGVVAFYVVNSVKPTIGANRCYLSASTGAKAIYFDEATAIAALQNASSIEGAYSASGVKNNGLKKGVNIVKMGDGSVQKIMVK